MAFAVWPFSAYYYPSTCVPDSRSELAGQVSATMVRD